MQTVTLIIHGIGLLLSVYLLTRFKRWKYFAWMLILSNGIGIVFYIMVLLQFPDRHNISLYRSMASALLSVLFAAGLIAGGKDA